MTDATRATPDTVGFLYPGYSAEDDYPRLEGLLGDSVRFPLVHTDIGEDAHRVDALLEMGSGVRLAAGVAELKERGAQAVIWSCTSASFVFGWEGAREQVRELEETAGLPASSTSFAFAHAVQALGAERVAIAATYPEDVAEYFRAFLKAAGAEVVSTQGSGIITAAEVGTWGREEVLRMARAGDHPDAQAVLLPDTALHTAAWLPDLEAPTDCGTPRSRCLRAAAARAGPIRTAVSRSSSCTTRPVRRPRCI
jgi:maleate cis-trans isomerase